MNRAKMRQSVYQYSVSRTGAVILGVMLLLLASQYFTIGKHIKEHTRSELIFAVDAVNASIQNRILLYRDATERLAGELDRHGTETLNMLKNSDFFPEFSYLLLTDPTGRIISTYPVIPGMLGKIMRKDPISYANTQVGFLLFDAQNSEPAFTFSRQTKQGLLQIVIQFDVETFLPMLYRDGEVYDIEMMNSNRQLIYASSGLYLKQRLVERNQQDIRSMNKDYRIFEFTNLNGRHRYAVETKVSELGWIIQLNADKYLFEAYRIRSLINTGILIAVLLAAMAGLLWVLVGRVLKPIRYLSDYFAHVSDDTEVAFQPRGEEFEEFHAMNRRFETMQIKIKEKEADLQEFAYMASHDLQEPLRTIGNYVQILEYELEAKTDEETGKYFGYVKESTKRLQQLIRDLLSYSQAGRIVHLEAVPLDAVATEVLASMEKAILEANAEIMLSPLPNVTADRQLIGQVFMNLIGNALKYRRPTEICRVRIYPTGKNIVVEDNGIGIPARFFEEIFKPFKRLHPAHVYPGTGIGLSLVKKIVEQHGWHISVESRENEYTRFVIDISEEST